jgi:TrmH family RNA methyltransferase
LSDLKLKKNAFIVVAESIEKPGNLGTILRSCDAAGVDAVIVCDPTTDIHNPNVVRSSVGTLFTVPVFEATADETMAFLKKNQVAVVAGTPHAKKEFTQVDLTISVAIVVGTEQYGLSEMWMKGADIAVSIPMLGVADSLNVASATTLLLYEVVRQRRNHLFR